MCLLTFNWNHDLKLTLTKVVLLPKHRQVSQWESLVSKSCVSSISPPCEHIFSEQNPGSNYVCHHNISRRRFSNTYISFLGDRVEEWGDKILWKTLQEWRLFWNEKKKNYETYQTWTQKFMNTSVTQSQQKLHYHPHRDDIYHRTSFSNCLYLKPL